MTRIGVKPRLLDLFCGEGGAAAGYAEAGWEVTGVDHRFLQDRYPYRFILGDALKYVAAHGREFDAIHASPPCQVHSVTKSLRPTEDLSAMLIPLPKHVDLIPATREALTASGKPWVIENVPGAPLQDPLTLCGTMFGLGAICQDDWRDLLRHRLFESPLPLNAPSPCDHRRPSVIVAGHGGGRLETFKHGYMANLREARQAIGMPWASRAGVSQAIPPAYTHCIGRQILRQM